MVSSIMSAGFLSLNDVQINPTPTPPASLCGVPMGFFWPGEYETMRLLCDSFVPYGSDSLTQQTTCDLVTPGCQGERGGAMAGEGAVGESQLQRIIRDLHGTLPFRLRPGDWLKLFFPSSDTMRLNGEEKKVSHYMVTSGTLSHHNYTLGTACQLLFGESVWDMSI